MRIFTLTASCAAIGFSVLSCTSDGSSSAGSTGGGSTSASSTSSSTSASSTGSGGGAAASAIVDLYCNTLAAPYCDAEYACCTLELEALGHFRSWCESYFLAYGVNTFCTYPEHYNRNFLEASLAAGTTIFDKAQLDACLALFKQMSAGGAACVAPTRAALNTICLGAFKGTLAPGAACDVLPQFVNPDTDATFECKDGRCDKGKCLPFLKTGDACSQALGLAGTYGPADTVCNYVKQEVCRGALADGGSVVVGTCGPQGELGDPCNPGNYRECKSLTCDATGKCAVPDPEGKACSGFY